MFKNLLSAALLGLSANAEDTCWHVPDNFVEKTSFDGAPYIDFKWTRPWEWPEEDPVLDNCRDECEYFVV